LDVSTCPIKEFTIWHDEFATVPNDGMGIRTNADSRTLTIDFTQAYGP
jgi:hypothetical protein